VWSVTSDAVVFGIPPNYLTMPSGFHKVLFGNDSLIFNDTSSSFFGVSQLGAGSLDDVSYGTYVVLYPRVGVVNATSSDVASSSAYVAYVFVPVVVARFNPALPNLLVANVTAPSMVTIESPLYLKYACGPIQQSFPLSSYSKIEIVEIEVIIEYG